MKTEDLIRAYMETHKKEKGDSYRAGKETLTKPETPVIGKTKK